MAALDRYLYPQVIAECSGAGLETQSFFGVIDQRRKVIDKYSRRLETKKFFPLLI